MTVIRDKAHLTRSSVNDTVVGSAIVWLFHFIFRNPMSATLSALDRKLARLFDILGASTARRYGLGVPQQKAADTQPTASPVA